MALFTNLHALSRVIPRDLPLAAALVFARVADAGDAGVRQSEVQHDTGMGSSSMTRNCQLLGALHWQKRKPGLDLVSAEVDRNDARQRVLRLTAKGLQAAAALKAGGKPLASEGGKHS